MKKLNNDYYREDFLNENITSLRFINVVGQNHAMIKTQFKRNLFIKIMSSVL